MTSSKFTATTCIGWVLKCGTGRDSDDGRSRSRNRPLQRVPDALYNSGSFTFVGKQAPFESFNPARVLKDFGVLLPIYEYVEFEPESARPAHYQPRGFVFTPDPNTTAGARLIETTAHRTVRDSTVFLSHRALQDKLKHELQRDGAEVGTEHHDGKGGYIDLVARQDGALQFYEIKTDTSPRLALRNAIGQLLEYAYWPDPVKPARLVVVGASPLDAEAGRVSLQPQGANGSYPSATGKSPRRRDLASRTSKVWTDYHARRAE